jgi:hypothetical protein
MASPNDKTFRNVGNRTRNYIQKNCINYRKGAIREQPGGNQGVIREQSGSNQGAGRIRIKEGNP